MQGEARLPVACFSTGRHAVGVGDRRNGNSTSRNRRIALDIARWRGDHAGTSRRRSCRVLGWRGRSTPGVDMNNRRLLRRNHRGGGAPAVDVDDGWSRRLYRGRLYKGRLYRGRRGPPGHSRWCRGGGRWQHRGPGRRRACACQRWCQRHQLEGGSSAGCTCRKGRHWNGVVVS